MLIGLLAAVIPLALYLGLPSTQWNFDGVACAAAIELGNPVYWFHAQHLIYGFLGALSWKAIGLVGAIRALPTLQLLNSIVSAVAGVYLYRLFLPMIGQRWIALLLTTSAAVSSVVWCWSIEAQVYPIGYLGLAAATAALFDPHISTRRGIHTGAWHAFAVLGHVVHGLWIIPAIFVLRHERADLRRYLVTLTGIVLSAYAAVGMLVLFPYRGGPHWLSHWMKGSLGLTPDRSLAWHTAGWEGILRWAQTTPQMWWGTLAPYGGMTIPGPLKCLAVLSICLFIVILWRCVRHARPEKPIRSFSILWICTYAIFFSTWEPTTLCYRMTDMIPWTLLLVIGLTTIPSRSWKTSLACGWLGSLLILNAYSKTWPMHQAERNVTYQQTVALVKQTPADATYLTGGGLAWIYLLYFTGRSAWNAETLPENRLNSFTPPVFAHTSLLANPRLRDWIHGRSAEQISPEIPWLELK